MATSPNLPAGYSIVSIDGKRCTKVPRALTTVPGARGAQAATNSPEPTPSETPLQSSSSSPSPPSTSSRTPAAAVPVITSSTQSTSKSASTSSAKVATSETSADEPTVSKSTTSTKSSTHTALGLTSPSTFDNQNEPTATDSSSFHFPTASPSPVGSAVSSASDDSPSKGVGPGPIAGGVIGGIVLIGLIAFLVWFFRRRRGSRRDSLLTPLASDGRAGFNDNDGGSVGPTSLHSGFDDDTTSRAARIKGTVAGLAAGVVGLGAAFKSKAASARSDTPNVDLSRGNSQFFGGPIPQHSRDNSVLSDNHEQYTAKDRFNDWWARLTEKVWPSTGWEKEPTDQFTPTDGLSMSEKQSYIAPSFSGVSERQSNAAPSFSKFADMNDQELQQHTDNLKANLWEVDDETPEPALRNGNIILDLGTTTFLAGPSQNAQGRPWPSPKTATKINNIPSTTITQPRPSIQKPGTYVADIRRSRGQSLDSTNGNGMGYLTPGVGGLRYPSGAAGRQNYRDTVVSSASASARKGKGRSDPFDLERPELWRPPHPNTSTNPSTNGRTNRSISSASSRATTYSNSIPYPDPLRMSSVYGSTINWSDTQTRPLGLHQPSGDAAASKYSSGVSSLGGWGDPGPDLGPGSRSSSLRGIPSSDESSRSSEHSTGGGLNMGPAGIKGSLMEMGQAVGAMRANNNVSPVSLDAVRNAWNASPVSFESKNSKTTMGRAKS